MTLELQKRGKSALKAVSSHEEAYSTGRTAWLSKWRARSAGSTFPICQSRACNCSKKAAWHLMYSSYKHSMKKSPGKHKWICIQLSFWSNWHLMEGWSPHMNASKINLLDSVVCCLELCSSRFEVAQQ